MSKPDSNQPKVTVVTAVYNSEKFLSEAIESILRQSFGDFEFILINDCSPDGSLKILEKYAERDSRIKIINNSKNLGAAAARNLGIKEANGEYIAIFDSDDVSYPDRLEKQVGYLDQHPEIFLVGGSFEYINEQGKILDEDAREIAHEELKVLLPKRNVIHNPTVMFRNGAGYLYREKFLAAEDYDFWLRLLTDNRSLHVQSEIILRYRIQLKSITQTNKRKLLFFVKIARNYYKMRLKRGYDTYHDFLFSQTDFNRSSRVNDLVVQTRELKFFFKSTNEMQKFRAALISFWKTYGCRAWLVGYAYFVLSYLPQFFLKRFKTWIWKR